MHETARELCEDSCCFELRLHASKYAEVLTCVDDYDLFSATQHADARVVARARKDSFSLEALSNRALCSRIIENPQANE